MELVAGPYDGLTDSRGGRTASSGSGNPDGRDLAVIGHGRTALNPAAPRADLADVSVLVPVHADERRDLAEVLVDAVRRQPVRRIIGACLGSIALVATGDYLTGQDISFTVFYLLPVLLAAAEGERIGRRVALLTSFAWFAAEVAGRTTAYDTILIPVWNAAVRFLVFWFVVVLVCALARSLDRAQELSRRDPLSGLWNSRAFHEAAERERRALIRTRRPLTIAYVDVDDFKRINDRFGHAEGDRVIATIGEAITDSVRDVDTVARLGGDEFAILLPATANPDATAILQRIHDRLHLEAAARTWPIGFSIGAVTFVEAVATVDELVSSADRVMYKVKRDGKRALRCVTAG